MESGYHFSSFLRKSHLYLKHSVSNKMISTGKNFLGKIDLQKDLPNLKPANCQLNDFHVFGKCQRDCFNMQFSLKPVFLE